MDVDDMQESDSFIDTPLSQQIKRDYNIIRLLGRGGMGDVYLAEQLRVGRRPVALKVLNRSCSENPDLKRRFENEAASAGRIHHRNVVMIYESRVTDDGQLYVAMEYVEGVDLGCAIEERGTMPIDEVVEITKQIAAGLGAAHKLGIVHRDIKPGNILLTRDEDGTMVVKVLDFGIARLSEPDSSGGQTKTGVVMGTPDYMSPEQTLGQTGERIDARSDIYSLAMLVHKMLTGRVAFEADSWMQVMYKHVNETPRPPSQVCPQLGHIGAIDQVVLKGLEKDREKRQQTAVEFANELAAAYARLKPVSPQEPDTLLYPGSSRDTDEPFVSATTLQSVASPTSVEPIADTPYPATVVTKSASPAATHEIPVADSSGAFKKGAVTKADPDVASFKTVAMADPPRPAAAGPGTVRPAAASPAPAGKSKSPPAKRIAAVASAVILLGLSAAAFLVFHGSGKPPRQTASDISGHPGSAAPSQAPSSERAANAFAANNKNSESSLDETKRETSPSRSIKEATPRTASNAHDTSAADVPTTTKPTTRPAGESGPGVCLEVAVTRADGKPVMAARVTVSEESSGKPNRGLTGPLGKQRFCGLTPGHRVTVVVSGPQGKQTRTKQAVLTPGPNVIAIELQ